MADSNSHDPSKPGPGTAPDPAERRRLDTLMPWFVNGSLDEHETDALSAARESYAEMARDTEREVKLAQTLRRDPDALDALLRRRDMAFAALRQRIHAPRPRAEARRGEAAQDESARIANNAIDALLGAEAPPSRPRLSHRLSRRRYAAVACLVAALALGLVLINGAQRTLEPASEYQGLTGAPPVGDTAGIDGPVVQLVAEEHIAETAVRDLLATFDARILSGPSSNGVYRVEARGDADDLLAGLRAHPAVRFAEHETRAP